MNSGGVLNVAVQLCISSVVFAANAALVFYCIYHRIFRKDVVVTLFLCFADGISVGAQLFGIGRKMWIFIFLDPMETISNWDCFRMGYPLILLFSYPYTGFADLLFATEKMLMILWPMRYRRIRLRQIVFGIFVLTIVCISVTVYVAILWSRLDPWNVSVMCNSEHMPLHSRIPMAMSRTVTMSLAVIVYLPVVYKLIQIRKRARFQSAEYDSKTLRLAAHSGLLLLAVFISIVVPDIINFAFVQFYIKNQLIFFNIASMKPLCNVFFAVSMLSTLRSKRTAPAVPNYSAASRKPLPSRCTVVV